MNNQEIEVNEKVENIETTNDNITMLDLLTVCTNFLLEPNSEETQAAFNNIKEKMQVRTYLPLAQKENALERALLSFNAKTDEAVAFGTAQEVALMFNGLLSYVINLDMNDVSFYENDEIYDCFMASGLFDYILHFCHFDFYRMEQQYKGMFEYMNVKTLPESLNFASEDSVQSLAEEFKHFKLAQTPDVLKYYAKISETNDPLLNEVAEEIKEKAFEAAQEK